jgi:hypothetical protein
MLLELEPGCKEDDQNQRSVREICGTDELPVVVRRHQVGVGGGEGTVLRKELEIRLHRNGGDGKRLRRGFEFGNEVGDVGSEGKGKGSVPPVASDVHPKESSRIERTAIVDGEDSCDFMEEGVDVVLLSDD